MNQSRTYFYSRVLIFLLINVCGWSAVNAQNTPATPFGISFSPDVSDDEILTAMPELIENGISVIELISHRSLSILEELSEFPVQILVRSDIQFLTQHQLENSQEIQSRLRYFVESYGSDSRINGLGIISYSDEVPIGLMIDHAFADSVLIHYKVDIAPGEDFFTFVHSDYYDADENINVVVFEAPFSPNDFNTLSLAIDNFEEIILMDWYWYSEASQSETYFLDALIIAANKEGNLFPVVETIHEKKLPDWPVIILVLLWISLGIHLRSNLTYRPLLFRYFTYHRFFVDDIMRYRERSAAPGITLYIQHAYFTGLIVYILSTTFISNKGLEAFYHHLPLLAVFGQNYFTLFVLAVILSLAISFICLLWLYVPSKSMNHFSQVLNLYTWVFHVDFLLVSISLILLITGGSQTLILILGILHFLIWILGFIVTAYDSSKYLMKGRIKYLFNTAGILLIVTITIIFAFLFSGYPIDILQLALSL